MFVCNYSRIFYNNEKIFNQSVNGDNRPMIKFENICLFESFTRGCADIFTLFKLKCSGVELIILALFGYQLIVASALDYPSVLKDHDNI